LGGLLGGPEISKGRLGSKMKEKEKERKEADLVTSEKGFFFL